MSEHKTEDTTQITGSSEPEVDRSIEGLLLDIDRFASHDGPGIRTTVFLKGCPLSCLWCHSPESQRSVPEILFQPERCTACWLCLDACADGALERGDSAGRAAVVLDRDRCTRCGGCVDVCYPGALGLAGRTISVGELVDDVAKALPFFQRSGGGVTLSGGEPAAQFRFALNFLLACRQRGIHTALETTGYARGEVMRALADATDLLLYDVKILDPVSHRRHTGVDNALILENLQFLAAEGYEIQVRVPCIPGINDAREQIRDLARFIEDTGIKRIALLPYNAAAGAKYEWLGRSLALSGLETQADQYMNSLAGICQEEGLDVQVVK